MVIKETYIVERWDGLNWSLIRQYDSFNEARWSCQFFINMGVVSPIRIVVNFV